nr:immunoglobulin heavy chain junction region [Macaca mulatta]
CATLSEKMVLTNTARFFASW